MRKVPLGARAQCLALALAVAGSGVVFGRLGAVDGFGIAKATLITVVALAAVTAACWAAVRSAEITVPRAPVIAAASAFGVLLLARGLLADDVVRALVGPFGRWNGAVLYGAGVVLFVVAASRPFAVTFRVVSRWLVGAALVVGAFTVVSLVFGWNLASDETSGVASTLGNPNFLGSWAGIVLPFTLYMTLASDHPRRWRIAGGLGSALLLLSAVASQSLQAGYALTVVTAILLVVWSADRLTRRRWAVVAGLTGVAALIAGVVTVLGALQRGPGAFLGTQTGMRLRVEYWTVGVRMVREAPLLGTGPGTFSGRYRQLRSEETASSLPLASSTDSAHNVPLQLAAEWGLVVGLAFVVVLALVTVTFLRELRAREGQDRLRYGVVVAGWVVYVLQALISVDVSPLLALGWVLGGMLVAPQIGRVWSYSLPWRRSTFASRRRAPTRARVAEAGVGVVALIALWVLVLPLRADIASATRDIQAGAGASEATSVSTPATDIAPWEAAYWMRLAEGLVAQDELELASEALQAASTHAPQRFDVVLSRARLARQMGESETSMEQYGRALALEPKHPDLAIEVAELALEQGEADRARDLVQSALRIDPEHPGAQTLRDRL